MTQITWVAAPRWLSSSLLALVGSQLMVACAPADGTLVVQLSTDYAATDFDDVCFTLDDDTDCTSHLAVQFGQSFGRPVRIAAAEVTGGLHTVRLALSRQGEMRQSRQVSVRVDGTTVTTVLVTRSCEGSSCSGDRPECVAGQCVPAGCSPEAPTLCAVTAGCTADSECGGSECATARCIAGLCYREANDAACGAGSYCDAFRGCALTEIGAPHVTRVVTFVDATGAGSLVAPAVALAPSSGAIVASQFTGVVDLGGQTVTAVGTTDAFVVRYRDDGAIAWLAQLSGPGDDLLTGLDADDKHVYITGTASDGASIGGVTFTAPQLGYAVALDVTTGVVSWTYRFEGDGSAIRSTGNWVYVALDGDSGVITGGARLGPQLVVAVLDEGDGTLSGATSIADVAAGRSQVHAMMSWYGAVVVAGTLDAAATTSTDLITRGMGTDGFAFGVRETREQSGITSLAGDGDDAILAASGNALNEWVFGGYAGGPVDVGGEPIAWSAADTQRAAVAWTVGGSGGPVTLRYSDAAGASFVDGVAQGGASRVYLAGASGLDDLAMPTTGTAFVSRIDADGTESRIELDGPGLDVATDLIVYGDRTIYAVGVYSDGADLGLGPVSSGAAPTAGFLVRIEQ